MRIKSFTIKNYRSIKELKIDNLNPVNVFFGKNNVGKSNILRALHLAFYCLRADTVLLPDAMFFNRNIYKPIEVIIDLILEGDFCDEKQFQIDLQEAIQNIGSVVASKGEFLAGMTNKIDEFVEKSSSFHPLKDLRLKIRMSSGEKTTDVGISIEDVRTDFGFDYQRYKDSYREIARLIKEKMTGEGERTFRQITFDLGRLGLDLKEMRYYVDRLRGFPSDPEEVGNMFYRLERSLDQIENRDKRDEASMLLAHYREILSERKPDPIEFFSKPFDMVKGYFYKISDNFVLIPNKEYFPKSPFVDTDRKQRIEIFDMNMFIGRLVSLIGSPSRKQRDLIDKFYSIFNDSYSHLGRLETITKIRNEIFAIFGTSITSLPIDDQGLGVQDLFLYLAHMVLLDAAIIAIEEPEGGLSTENQKLLHSIVEDVYSDSDKQIFISSHSEEFETPNSYIIEIGPDGTRQISRMTKESEYEQKIEKVLIKRRLEEEKKEYKALLTEVSERQMALDVLTYISKLKDDEGVDTEEISNKLGYPKEKVQQILNQANRKR